MADPSVICIAGKGDIATRCLRWVVESGWPLDRLGVLCNGDDEGKHQWQYSLRGSARQLGVREMSLAQAEETEGLLFLSLEYDRLIKPDRFRSSRLFNLHFSKLPEYRGAHTAIWPILDGRSEAGVTLHRIDPGIDTGELIEQECFPLRLEWTSRDLYQAFMDHGSALVIRRLPNLMSGTEESEPQNPIGASFHSRKEIDFGNLKVEGKKAAFQVHNYVRAFSFFEYQLPTITGRQVVRSEITGDASVSAPGTVVEESGWMAVISTLDYDVRVLFNVWEELFRWARAGGEPPSEECLALVPDIDRTDRNGWNALMMAAWAGKVEALEGLLDHGADPSFANRRGTTPLMYAASHAEATGDRGAVEVLLKRGASVDLPDSDGMTVLDHLRRRGAGSLARFIETTRTLK